MGKRLHEQVLWLSFLLFLGIIGGILSYGPQGFVIGPMAVVLAYGLVRFLASQSVENQPDFIPLSKKFTQRRKFELFPKDGHNFL